MKHKKVFRTFYLSYGRKKNLKKKNWQQLWKKSTNWLLWPPKMVKHVPNTYVHLGIKIDFSVKFRPTRTIIALFVKKEYFFELAQRSAGLICKKRVPSRSYYACPEVLVNNFDFSNHFHVWKKLGVVLAVC